jgi:hypothetical protein
MEVSGRLLLAYEWETSKALSRGRKPSLEVAKVKSDIGSGTWLQID